MTDELNDDQNEPITEDDTTVVPPTPAPVIRNGRPDFASMTPREREFVQAARKEEKDKLYNEQKRLREENERLQAQVRGIQNAPLPTTVAAADAQNERLEKLLSLVERTNSRLDAIESSEVARRRETELRSYAQQQIAAMRENDEYVVESLVGGSNEDEIDESLLVARAEYQRMVMQEEARQAKAGRPRSSVTVQANGGRPAGAPRPVTPNTVEAENNESIKDITSDVAVRSGEWESKRTQVLGKMRRGFKYVSPQQG